MELKQITFFVTCAEEGSFGKAAEKMYTTQPNVSKVIRSLERELGGPLFERSRKGLVMTERGHAIYGYAKEILENADLITKKETSLREETFRVATYQSHVMTRALAKMIADDPDLRVEHIFGSVEQISESVAHGFSDIGVLYVSRNRLKAFRHIIEERHLEFHPIAWRHAAIYVNEKNPFYARDSIRIDELPEVRFIGGVEDYFSIEHNYAEESVGLGFEGEMQPVVRTNSEHLSTDLLKISDLAVLSIDLQDDDFTPPTTKIVYIDGEAADLVLGYILYQGRPLTKRSAEFLDRIESIHDLQGCLLPEEQARRERAASPGSSGQGR